MDQKDSYEFQAKRLADFCMHAPNCAPVEKKRELWRRIQVLRRSLGLETAEAEGSSNRVVNDDEWRKLR